MSNGYPANNVYIGARYVPKLVGEWDSTKETAYEPLIIVTYQGDSYTSRQYVPAGVDIGNTEYWVLTGNFNGQIESFRLALEALNNKVNNTPLISIKMFGAVGNGIADDTEALEAAVSDGRPIYFDNGRYLCKRTITFNNARLIGPGTVVFSEPLSNGIVCQGDYAIVNGLTIDGSNLVASGLTIVSDSAAVSHVQVKNIKGLTDTGAVGINCVAKENVCITDCDISNVIRTFEPSMGQTGSNGIFARGRNVIISNIKVSNIRATNVHYDCDDVYVQGIGDSFDGQCFITNVISNDYVGRCLKVQMKTQYISNILGVNANSEDDTSMISSQYGDTVKMTNITYSGLDNLLKAIVFSMDNNNNALLSFANVNINALCNTVFLFNDVSAHTDINGMIYSKTSPIYSIVRFTENLTHVFNLRIKDITGSWSNYFNIVDNTDKLNIELQGYLPNNGTPFTVGNKLITGNVKFRNFCPTGQQSIIGNYNLSNIYACDAIFANIVDNDSKTYYYVLKIGNKKILGI